MLMTPARFPTPAERERRARLIKFLDDGKVLLQVAPQCPGVDLPPHLRTELAVGLALSRRFGLKVLELGPLEVKASLSFNGERYLCVLPWMAIFAMKSFVTDEHAFYAESVPPELLAGLALAQETPEAAKEDTPEGSEAREVPEGSEEGDEPPPDEDPPSGRPRLRLVKS